ncbi:MAG: helix-turn-helix domain-containing protein [bacterium]
MSGKRWPTRRVSIRGASRENQAVAALYFSPESMPASRTPPFTALQGQYLSFMHTYESIHGCAPAEADLQRHFGVTPPTVHQMIVTLERKGLITRVAGAARSISLQISPSRLPPLARRGQSPAEREGSPRSAIRSRRMANQTTRKPNSGVSTRAPKQDAVAEYIDSPLTTRRLRFDRSVSAQIAGRYGDYRTTARLSRTVDGDCSCPSDVWPCKHIRALRATWEANPGSFFDLESFLRRLESAEKEELIKSIGEIVVAFPQALGLFSVSGFDETEDGDDERHDADGLAD